MRTESQELGLWGEHVAEEWLVARGWTVIDRQFRVGHRDIDLIVQREVQRELTTAFVEVKTRRDHRHGEPIEAVHYRKQREIIRSARTWLARQGKLGMAYRFDVIGILFDGDRTEVTHVENAFDCN